MPTPDYLGTPYVRVWLTLLDDHPTVWSSDALLAWWLRLLINAQRMYPAPAPLPRSLPVELEAELVSEGVIEPIGSEAYRFHGLEDLRVAEAPRGQAGGTARARSGQRDRFGRWLPDAGHMLDNGRVNAGESARADVLVPDAGVPANENAGRPANEFAGRPASQPLDETRRADANRVSSLPRGRERAGARTREAEPDPSAIACDAYSEHRAEHRWIEGVGWRCMICERARAQLEPTFTERVVAHSGELDDDDRPF